MKLVILLNIFPLTHNRLFRSIHDLSESGTRNLEGGNSVDLTYPKGPFSLIAHAYNERDGAVWRVKDREGNQYDLKVFMVNTDRSHKDQLRRTDEFTKEKARMLKLGKLQCPDLSAPSEGMKIKCRDRHVQIALASDVQIIDEKSGNLIKSTMDLQIPNARGRKKNRQVLFSSNILFESMPGGILSKMLKMRSTKAGETVRKFGTFVHRYPVFVSLAPQLVDALRFLHKQGFVHLSLDAPSVLCKDSFCKRAVLTDLTTSWDGKGSSPIEAHELMQPSVRFALFYGRGAYDHKWPSDKMVKTILTAPTNMSRAEFDKNVTLREAVHDETEVMFNPLLSVAPVTFKEARLVDWYALGATLFYVMTGQRPMVDDFKDTSSSKLGIGTDAADFVHSSLLSLFNGNKQGKVFKAVEKHVTESMLLVDGLLQEFRKNRISFDDDVSANHGNAEILPKRLRRPSQLQLQAEEHESTTSSPPVGKTCRAFVSTVSQQEFNIQYDDKSLPPFMASICRL